MSSPAQERPGLAETLRELRAEERVAALAALVIPLSMLLPWYGIPLAGDLVKTGLGAFGFVEAALVLTAGAALFLILERARGTDVPLPLREGTLLAAAGVWSTLLLIYRMIDRPEFELGGFTATYQLRYGIFVGFAGAIVLTVAGLRRRAVQRR